MAEQPTNLFSQVPGVDQNILLLAVEQNPVSIVITDPQAAIIYVNPQFCRVTGYAFDEVVGKNPRVLKGDDGFTDYAELWATLQRGEKWRGEFHNRRKDGSYFWEIASISPIQGENGETLYYMAIKEDITERKQAEELLHQTVSEATQLTASVEYKNFQLEKAQKKLDEAYQQLKNTQSQMLQREKMASIGQLAAGVAHEINNPMGFISSNLRSFSKYLDKLVAHIGELEGLLARDAGLQAEARQLREKARIDFLIEDGKDLLAESLEGADRVKEIVQGLKSFSRVDRAELAEVNLNECLESTISIAWNEIKYKATLEKDLGELALLSCHPQQINQVFLNVLVNAAQSIEGTGKIRVRSWQDEENQFVAISDNGQGMTEEVKKRIFEPFYTTKEVGKGTGLGMSISYEIIKKHGGRIELESEVGIGTTFTIVLPRKGLASQESGL